MRERRDKRREEREKEESDERDMRGEVGNVCRKQFSALLCNLEVAVLGLDAALQGLSASTNASTK